MKILPDRLMVRKGTFYFRLWVPKDIVPFYGLQLVVTSLRTKDLKTAKSRLARKTVEADEHFEELRSEKRLSSIAMTAADQLVHQSAFPEIVSSHAREDRDRDREFEQRSALYTSAISDPMRLWSGDLLPLPSPSDFGHGEADAYTYFDHLVADGDLDKVIGYLNRFRLFTRINDLKRMRATGDIGTFVAVAHERLQGLMIERP